MTIADFTDCKRDPLHLIGAIQPLGVLVVVDAGDGRISACSDNVQMVLGRPSREVLGTSAAAVFGDCWPELAALARDSGRCRIGTVGLQGSRPVTVVAHRRGDRYLLELEQRVSTVPAWWDEPARIRFVERLSGTSDHAGIASLLAETVSECTGYDRVMVYRFLEDWDGEVIEQRCREGIEGFLGLRFPAGDIPANARELYTVNWQRIIADTEADNVGVRAASATDAPQDMSFSILRAVHPVHVRYLRNMGVRGSFSLSLVVDGRLWGLVACHHLQAKPLDAHERLSLEEMARLASLHLGNLLRLQAETRLSVLRERLSVLDQALDPGADDPGGILADQLDRVRDLLDADGVWLHFQDTDYRSGELPAPDALIVLDEYLRDRESRGTAYFDALPEPLRAHRTLVERSAGAILLALDGPARLIAVRREVVQDVQWAGRQECANGGKALSPRRSFEAWREKVRYHASPWEPPVLEIAAALRMELIEYLEVLRDKERAYSDPLTGLANRHAFDEGLTAAVADNRRSGRRFALHLVDLDRFKPVNDTYGHAAGDTLLQVLAGRLLELARRHDVVARLGGDEFAVIQRDVAGAQDAETLAARIVEEMARPVPLAHRAVQVGASVGIALYPDDAPAADALRERADAALYVAKEQGRGAYRRA